MIDQAMDMEYSGTDLAFSEWSGYVKKFLLMNGHVYSYVLYMMVMFVLLFFIAK